MLTVDKHPGRIEIRRDGEYRVGLLNEDIPHLIAMLSHAALGRVADPEEIGTMTLRDCANGMYPELHLNQGSAMEPGLYQLSARRVA